ncbi:amino acid ABC transporter substrate-binding protein [Actinoplanes sp. L3-i22]|uniref:amino acid ABC transporter substrate-binding protein n=1 Tax=Actinoplanes sp. L3-i22 TaxID=2836373 RepID=UPI001C764141|nr:amino acid ABC transporter substrate-binding protein [Actinoplanes sp. L3-i22]BCY11801.1 branched-chain amino acid ABC transporter substrate-binding protein [Actinoplanes sp. L3-i22]
MPPFSAHRLPLALGLTAVLLTGCVPSRDTNHDNNSSGTVDKIVIGSTLPLTGTESKTGARFKQGFDLAFELANADGGIDLGGKKVPVELKLLDDTTDQAKAVNLAQRLITQDKVNAFLGTYSTSLVEAQSTVAEQNKIPYVTGGGAATSIYAKGYQWVFGTLAPVANLAGAEMSWIDTQQAAGSLPKPAKLAIVWENSSHGQDFRKGIKDFVAAHSAGYQIVTDESFALDGKDFSAILSKVRTASPDLFMVDAHLPDFITMQRQYLSSGMCNKVITYGARGTESDAKAALGQAGVNYILSAVWWNKQLGNAGLNKEFVEKYKAKYGADPEWYQALGYEAARSLFTAIGQAGSVDKEQIRQKLSALDMDSILPGGKLSYPAAKGGQADYPFVVQQNLPDGTSPIIYPAQVATGKGVAPNPNCKG